MSGVEKMPVTVYTTSSRMRTPGALFRSMLAGIRQSRELSYRLFLRDLSAQYRQSLFGILWAFAPPIVTGLVFILLRSNSIVNFGETDIPYPVFALIGTMLWQIFTDSLNAPLKSVTAAKPLLAKISFPHEALIVSAFLMSMFNFLIKFVLIILILIIFNVGLTWGSLLAPAAAVLLVFLGITVGLLVTPVGMLYTDVGSALPIITQLLFFLTPVVYPPPQSFPFSLLVILNPISPFLIASRDLLTKGAAANVELLLVVTFLTLIMFICAWVVYRISLPIIIERISA